MEYLEDAQLKKLLEYKNIVIKPGIEKYPYGPIYTLSIMVDDIEFYKFSGVVPDDTIECFMRHLKCLLTDYILTDED